MKLADIKAGDYVCTDGGFTCLKPGLYLVEKSSHGLYICCDCGEHYLDGQEDEEGSDLVGISVPDIRTTQEQRHDLGMKV